MKTDYGPIFENEDPWGPIEDYTNNVFQEPISFAHYSYLSFYPLFNLSLVYNVILITWTNNLKKSKKISILFFSNKYWLHNIYVCTNACTYKHMHVKHIPTHHIHPETPIWEMTVNIYIYYHGPDTKISILHIFLLKAYKMQLCVS